MGNPNGYVPRSMLDELDRQRKQQTIRQREEHEIE